jgi:Domain of unknown function (DUF4352)
MSTSSISRAAFAAVLLLCVAGCGGGGGKSSGGGAAASSDEAKAAGKPKTLAIGDETTLKGLHGSMKVKVLKVEDPMKAPPAKGLIREVPRKGNRFVGVQVALTNVGDKPYSDSILNGARLVTDVAKASQPTILLSGKCQSKFGTKTRVAPGASKSGCLPFQVKKAAKVSGFELTLDSGYGPEKGAWAVR